jgi:hypothetical protein
MIMWNLKVGGMGATNADIVVTNLFVLKVQNQIDPISEMGTILRSVFYMEWRSEASPRHKLRLCTPKMSIQIEMVTIFKIGSIS